VPQSALTLDATKQPAIKAIAIKKGRHRIDIKVANPEFGNILTLVLCD
jgi:hypothetical protein